MDQATRSEKRAASLGLHSLSHTNATAMDSLGIPQQIRKQRLGHSGNSMTESWPEKENGKLISFPIFPKRKNGLPGRTSKPL